MPPTGIYHTELHNLPLVKKKNKTKQRETKRQENEDYNLTFKPFRIWGRAQGSIASAFLQ